MSSLLMKTINKLPPARQVRTCVLTTKASTRLRHPLVPFTPRRFQPSTPPPTHALDTPPHSHISITLSTIRHNSTAISSIPTCYVATRTKPSVPAASILQRCYSPAPYKHYLSRGLGIPANPLSTYTASWLLPICQVRDPALRSFPLSF